MCDPFHGCGSRTTADLWRFIGGVARILAANQAAEGFGMKWVDGTALTVACLLAVAPGLYAQAAKSSDSSSQNKPAANSQSSPAGAQQPARSQQQNTSNPFPADTSSVPVMPSRDSSGSLPATDNEATPLPLPPDDLDPVRTPEEAGAAAEAGEQKYSSSLSGMSDVMPPDDDTTHSGKRNRKGSDADIAPEHHESAKEDENVGSYYLSNKDFKGALSRFESALVLDPDNPDVYWGLAECQRNTGDYADARKNYLKVMEYDPNSHHAKDARKHLDEPEIANAKPQSPAHPAPAQ
jgi:tetratricopeptide (TPR) repeat protein